MVGSRAWTLLAPIAAMVLCGGRPAPAAVAAPAEIDYRVPSAEQLAAWRSAAAVAVGPVCLGCGIEAVDYEDFDGAVHRLWRHPGRYVALLLPERLSGRRLRADDVLQLLDVLDLAYASYADLLGGEPVGEGLLPIAFVDVPLGGRAFLGNKGIEIDPSLERDILRVLSYDAAHWVLLHEMGHNFDLYSSHTQYLRDHPHAWTFWMDLYLPFYNRAGESDAIQRVDSTRYMRVPRSPRERLREGVRGTWGPWLEDPDSEWVRCVRNEDCFWWSSQSWGAFHLYLASLFGPRTTKNLFSHVAAAIDGFVPGAPERREEIWLDAWAAATGSDVSCYAEVLRWHTSDTLRDRLQALYGRNPPLCRDRDGDGVRGIEGDCDDRDAAVRPGRDDPANGVDDDCDGHLDEVSVRERRGSPQEIEVFPAEVAARGRRGERKEFAFDPAGEEVVWAETCFHGEASGWFRFLRGGEESLAEGADGACVYSKLVPEPGEVVRLRHDIHGDGEYDLILGAGDPWPVSWAKFAAPRVQAKRVKFRVETDESGLDETPTHVRFWVTGTGWVATRRYRPRASGAWKLPAGVPPGTYGVRAQLLRDGIPVSQISPMRTFEIE